MTHCAQLGNTVEVHGCVVGRIVQNLDLNIIANGKVQRWTWRLSIYKKLLLGDANQTALLPGDIELKLDLCSERK